MDSGDSGSGSSSSQKCATPFHRHTIDVVHPAPERPQQQKRYSEDTALAPLRPIAGPSNVRYNTPHLQATHLRLFEQSHALAQNQVQNPSRRALIDSGFITTTPISQSQRSSTVDMSTRLSQLIPSTEDRPDLWQDDQVAPTFRPRNPSNTGDGSSNTGDGSPRRNRRDWSRARSSPLTRYVWYILLLLGYSPGSRYKDERRIVAITLAIETLLFGGTLGMLIFSGIRRSPVQPTISEWTACDKPLGIWGCVWLAKVIVTCVIYIWEFRLDWVYNPERRDDVEFGIFSARRADSTRASSAGSGSRRSGSNANSRERRHPRAYTTLVMILGLIVFVWFIVSCSFIFTSTETCRIEAPHLWWLSFTILIIQSLSLIESIISLLVILIVAPMIFLFLSFVLLCFGRNQIHPQVGKLSKKIVDSIPLVVYIPAPPQETADEKGKDNSNGEATATGEIMKAETVHVAGNEGHAYPPKPAPAARSRGRFRLLRRKLLSPKSLGKKGAKSGSVDSWEAFWEAGEYPFVKLAENRATCAICLMDFEAPKKRVASEVIASWSQRKDKENKEEKAEAQKNPVDKVKEDKVDASEPKSTQDASSPSGDGNTKTDGQSQNPALESVEEGAQPLRLLGCGHVFHKTCIDPWLTDVSGRCPLCQQPITGK